MGAAQVEQHAVVAGDRDHLHVQHDRGCRKRSLNHCHDAPVTGRYGVELQYSPPDGLALQRRLRSGR
ncbi:hypothetical protein D3C85_1240240 [compost metagenome]